MLKVLSVVCLVQVSWGKKVLLVGGKTDSGSDRVSGWITLFLWLILSFIRMILILSLVFSVWTFDTETECWSLMDAKGDIPVTSFKLIKCANHTFG